MVAGNEHIHFQSDLSNSDLSALGYQEHPFIITANPRFFYVSPAYRAVMSQVLGIVENHEGMTVIEGPLGSGKTILSRSLLDQFATDPAYKAVYLHASYIKTETAAIQTFAKLFGHRIVHARNAQYNLMEKELLANRKAGINTVLIIDDAEFMSADSLNSLQMLLNFDVYDKMIQIVLFGQPSIHIPFGKNESVTSRVVAWQPLPPLPLEDVAGMIAYRNRVAGRESPLMEIDAIAEIYKYSKGNPRMIVVLCREILRLLATSKRIVATLDDVTQTIEAYKNRPKPILNTAKPDYKKTDPPSRNAAKKSVSGKAK